MPVAHQKKTALTGRHAREGRFLPVCCFFRLALKRRWRFQVRLFSLHHVSDHYIKSPFLSFQTELAGEAG